VNALAAGATGAPLGRWRARRVRAATRLDVGVLVLLTVLGALTVALGRRAHITLMPRSAIQVAALLNDLDVPTRLPDVPMVDAAGQTSLLAHLRHDRTVVAFYAPWCGPCQKELPALARQVSKDADILVVISADEDAEEARGKLVDIGVPDLPLLVDVTGRLHREARVEALPTTFLVNRYGAVLMRLRGYSPFAIYRLKALLGPAGSGGSAWPPASVPDEP
jgi:thiol-disulfide isomerase/thioredoxin